jgi:hypothetical protein
MNVDQALSEAGSICDAAEGNLVATVLADEVLRLRGIVRTAADKLERVGYDETASRIRARVSGERVGLGE